MKLKNTLLASTLLTTATLSAHTVTELTPEQAAALKPHDRAVVTGRLNAIGDAVQAVSRRADKDGAASLYVVDTSDYSNGGNWRVTTGLYKDNAPQVDTPKNRIINGVVELPKNQAVTLMSYDTVTVQGFYRSQPEVNGAVIKAARAEGAYAFFIVRQVDANQGGNQRIIAYIYKEDAGKHVLQSPDAIPANFDAGRATLAKGGEAARNVEIPGVTTTAAAGSGTDVGRFFETQLSKGGRYTVMLSDSTEMEEVNKVTTVRMMPFDNIQLTGNYGSMTETPYQTAKRAAEKGAKYYHITRQWQERGDNITISADLYK